MSKQLKFEGFSVDFVEHACALISFEGKKIFFDPWKLPKNSPKADLVFVSHEHFDHFSPEAIKKISKPSTVIVTNGKCGSKLLQEHVKTIEVGKTINVQGVDVTGVQAYNIGKKFHPKGLGNGFVADLGGHLVYHAGDTDFIPEMKQLKDIFLAFLPIGGTYTMNAKEAAMAANSFLPKFFVPIHYNIVEGTQADPDSLAELVKKEVKVEILYK